MTTEIIKPANHEEWLQMRVADVTSTESSALFGMSPYMTRFELWHNKRAGMQSAFSSNERMDWGNRLEAAIAHGMAEDHGWEIRPLKEYMRDPDLRMGSSFDYVITNLPGGPAHLEIKNVDLYAFKDGWAEDDWGLQAPEHIEMQVQHQMAVSSFKRSFIGALVGGNRTVVIERKRDEEVIAGIKQRIAKFWASVDAGQEPAPSMPEDADAVIRLHQYAQPGKILDASNDANIAMLVARIRVAKTQKANGEEDEKIAKAELLAAIGDAEKVMGSDWTISASQVADTPPMLVTADMVGTSIGGRAGYRSLRINKRKAK